MAKIIYRLDLTQEEFNSIKDKLDEKLIEKIKEIEISDKKIESTKKATSIKTEQTRQKFLNALVEFKKKQIEETQYNLKKHFGISYKTSKKYFQILEIAKKNIENISIEEHKALDESIELDDEKICIYEFEKFLLAQR
jgi:hypothetical protein